MNEATDPIKPGGPTSPDTAARTKCRPTCRKAATRSRKIFHGRGEQLYQDGMEDRIGALVLHALVLFNARYVDAALTQLRDDGFEVRHEDIARLSPFVRHHINVLGGYSFQLPDLPGGLRPRRDTYAADNEQPRIARGRGGHPAGESGDGGLRRRGIGHHAGEAVDPRRVIRGRRLRRRAVARGRR
nr:transposase [Streptomyces hygroscopicus]